MNGETENNISKYIYVINIPEPAFFRQVSSL